MSNLASKFDVLRGWPNGSALSENHGVLSTTTLKEGLLVVLDTATAGNVILPTAIAAQNATTPTKLRMVIQGNDQFDGKFLNKVVDLRGQFTVATDQYVAGSYTAGDLLTISVAVDATQGQLKARAGTEQVVGEVESYDSVAGILTVSMSL